MNYNKVLLDGFFLIFKAYGSRIDYKSIDYFTSEEKLTEYIRYEYSGTDFASICNCSLEELRQGVSLSFDKKQGTGTAKSEVLLIHGSNFSMLFNMLDKLSLTDFDGERLYLSKLLKQAETEDEITEIIDIYNDEQDNYW